MNYKEKNELQKTKVNKENFPTQHKNKNINQKIKKSPSEDKFFFFSFHFTALSPVGETEI